MLPALEPVSVPIALHPAGVLTHVLYRIRLEDIFFNISWYSQGSSLSPSIMAGGSTLRGLYTLLVTLSLLSAFCAADAVGDLQTKGRPSIDAALASSTTCTKSNVKVRREW
jgi:hypothetical protein